MKEKIAVVALAASLLITGSSEALKANFGDAVVGGVVGGVVGSVITNEVYRSGRRRAVRRHTYRKKRYVAAPKPVMTDEKRIQKALASLGFYHGPIDGQINSFETRTAIKELNRAYEIGDTAYLSPQEKDALIYMGTLLEFDRALISQGSDQRSKTKRIQAALKLKGFYHGSIDGSNGPMTRNAIASYKSANGLGSGYYLNYEDEYRLIDSAKKENDKNIEDTIASLRRLGASKKTDPSTTTNSTQPVILQPTQHQTQSAPVQSSPAQETTNEGTIVQEAPAPLQNGSEAPVNGTPNGSGAAQTQQSAQ